MRIFITLICGLVINFTWTQFQDDFGQSSGFPTPWEGQTSNFILNNEELRLSTSGSGNSGIYLEGSFLNFPEIELRLKIRQNFSPSGNNRLNLFIFSDSVNVSNSQNALYLQFGESGSNDAIALRGMFQGTDLELTRGQSGRIANAFELEMRLTYINSVLTIELWNSNQNQYEHELTYLDTSNILLNLLYLDCHYTSSNATKFYFDDLYIGPPLYDTLPPEMTSFSIIDSNLIEVIFSESIDTVNISLNQISINNPANQIPSSISFPSLSSMTIEFSDYFENDYWTDLNLGLIKDLEGNEKDLDTSFHVLYGEHVVIQDIEITEIFPDPSPSQGMPLCEYIELKNSSQKIIDLKGMFVCDLSDSNRIDSSYYFYPDTYVLFVDYSCVDSFPLTNMLALDLPGLNNSSDRILFLGSDSSLIDSVRYFDDWYDPAKDEGGYSLEKAQIGLFCGQENWVSTLNHIGGTPGEQNSIFDSPLNYNFQVLDWFVSFSNQIDLHLNKSVETAIQNVIISCNHYLVSFSANEKEIQINLGPDIFPGDIVEIEIQNLQDCFGNQLDTLIHFEVPYGADSNNLVINEILFDPESGGSDYIEIYNQSEKIIDISNLLIANRVDDTISNKKSIIELKYLLKPKNYLVITKDSNWIINVFETNINRNFIQLNSLPSFPNDLGTVVLIDTEERIIDEVPYDANMHYPLLTNIENKSLERIAFEVASSDRENWNTASGEYNFGTPGYRNSQQSAFEMETGFVINEDYFSPNNDGLKDNLIISIESSEPVIAHLNVFNLRGQLIQKLIDAEYLLGRKNVIWKGIDENGNLSNSGFYLLHLQTISTEGKKKEERKMVYLKR